MVVCEMKDGEHFQFDYDARSVYEKVSTVTAKGGDEVVDVLVRRILSRVDAKWVVVDGHNEHCNYLAEVKPVRVKLGIGVEPA